MKALAMIAVAAGAALLPAALSSAQTQAAPSGQDLFVQKCALCHASGGWGTRALARRMAPARAELLARPSVPATLVKVVVRRGIGSMPQFTPTDLTDEELDRLARWLENRQ